MEFLPPSIDQYSADHSSAENDVLADLNRTTQAKVLRPRMLSGHIQGRVLSMFSHMIKPQRVLEIGTYTGYSAICMAEGLAEGGKVHTIDINEELESLATSYFEKAGFDQHIQFHVGSALEIIPTLKESWDLVFIDADKENYSAYFDSIIENVRPDGFIIADNVLWSGKVVEGAKAGDLETESLIYFNKKVHTDSRVENVLFPIRDGLMVCRKR